MRVDIALLLLPHYRSGLVRELGKNAEIEVRWLLGETSSERLKVASLSGQNVVRLRNRKLPFGLTWQSGLLGEVRRSKPDVLVLTGDPRIFSTWLILAICRLLGVRTLLWTHGWNRVDSGVKRLVRLTYYRLADGLMLYGERARRLGFMQGYRKPMYVIYNSTNVVLRESTDLKPVDRNRPQKWIIVSRLMPQKGFDRVLRAVKFLADDGRDVRLTVVGDGPESEYLQDLANQLGVQASFQGAVYDMERLNAAIDSSDILVSPYNVGLSAMQSMARGCPVATSSLDAEQMPEAEAVRNWVTGVRFDPYSIQDIANKTWSFVEESDRASVAQECVDVVDMYWNAENQASRFSSAVLSQARL